MTQIGHVKERYMKLDQAVKTRDGREKEGERNRIDKEVTARIIKHALGSQIEDDKIRSEQIVETERARKKKNYLSSSDSESSSSESEGNKKKKKVSKLPKSKTIKKPLPVEKTKKHTGAVMHGATVVPEAAHVKFKKLLEKKRK